MPSLSELIAQKLTEANVDVVFGLPGGENVEALDALRKRGIQFVLVRNESSAVFMADARARLTGGIGVALTTLGPGATNAYAGVAHAFLDRAPVLLLTAQTDPKLVGSHTHQALDLQAVFKPVTKFTASLTPENANETLDHALRILRANRPGPAHLSVPAAFANRPVNNISLPSPSPAMGLVDRDRIARAGEILSSSRRPVIVAGLGLEPDKPYSQLRALAESLHAPVIDTPKSKGALPADHPLFVGTLGLTTTDPAYEILDASDCILAIGFDVVELVKPWAQPQPTIWISNWENDDPRIDAECELVGGLNSILDALLDSTVRVDETWGEKKVSAWREARLSPPKSDTAPNRISPADALSSIRSNTPPETIVTTDVGSHKIFTALNWRALEPNAFFVSNGLSAMGFGVASAIAAARATRKPTVCVTGDAGLAMGIGELAIAVELDLPLIVVVMNDSALDLIRFAQTKRDLQVFGTEFINPNYELVARGYGFEYARIENRNQCDAAIVKAVAGRKPALLEMMIDAAGYR
ncbi:MAG: Acetolactate synthase isozyme 3 large subunit [Anaerolineales bacterium]|nr:Acetolactate synthase isozyme 3 large subunit [Anaerolineales bacterium]